MPLQYPILLIQSQTVQATELLVAILDREMPWAIAVGSEIARYSGIIAQVLLEVREMKQQQISVFAGKEFNVDPETKSHLTININELNN